MLLVTVTAMFAGSVSSIFRGLRTGIAQEMLLKQTREGKSHL